MEQDNCGDPDRGILGSCTGLLHTRNHEANSVRSSIGEEKNECNITLGGMGP